MLKFKFPILIALLVSLVSCNKEGGSDKNFSDVKSTGIGKKGGIFQFNLGQQPTTLNPLSSTDYYASVVQSYIQEGLASRNVDTYEWEPSLATSWETSEDGLEFTFKLREGVKWHDGKPFSADDVKFTFDAIMDKENRWKTAHSMPYFENFKEVVVIDPLTVKFVAKVKYFKNFSVAAGFSPVPKHIYEDLSDDNKKKLNKTLIGTGPYKLDRYRRGKDLMLAANPNYWGKGTEDFKKKYNFSKILMRFIKDGTIAITRAEKGEIDYLSLSSEEYMQKAKGDRWGVDIFKKQVQNKSPSGYGFIGWNLANPMFQSKKTRLALYHLVNRRLMNEKFNYGLNELATGPVYRRSKYANPDVKPVEYDPKKALKLLKEDGWKVGEGNILQKMIDGKKTRLSFTILEPNKEFVKNLTIFKEDAVKAGVDVKIKFIEWTSFIKLLDERKFEAVRLGWSGGDIEWDPKQIWHSDYAKSGSNFIGYSNPEVDKLIDEARVTLDEAQRIKILRKVYKTIAEDVPYVFFFNSKFGHYAHTKRMKMEKETYTYGIGLDYWWIQK